MMAPALSRSEMNKADDIIAEIGVVKTKPQASSAYGSLKAQCEGKKAFDTRALADTASRRLPGRAAYRCRYCRKWHVGGTNKAR